MERHHYVPMRRHHDIPIRRRDDVPLRRLGNVPLRRRRVFHLRRTCDVTGTYRETSLRRRHDVFLPGGVSIKKPKNSVTLSHINDIIIVPFSVYLNQCSEVSQLLKHDDNLVS